MGLDWFAIQAHQFDVIRSIVICQLVPEVTVEKPESQIKATTPLNANAQITAAAIGLLTAAPLGSLLGWWAIRIHKGTSKN